MLNQISENKSNFNPKKGQNNILDTVCETPQNLPLDSTECISTLSNLSNEETSALKSLTNDENILIKEADKGGVVVILDTVYYHKKNGYALKQNFLPKKNPEQCNPTKN